MNWSGRPGPTNGFAPTPGTSHRELRSTWRPAKGANAIWLADRGWEVTAVDFSVVAMDKAKDLAARQGEGTARRIHWVVTDLLSYTPVDEFDLVMVIYLQVAVDQRRTVLQRAAAAVAPGGTLLVVAHHVDNIALGVGGPQDPAVLYSEYDVLADLAGFPWISGPPRGSSGSSKVSRDRHSTWLSQRRLA